LVKLAKALDVEVHILFLEKPPAVPVNVQDTLVKFKKDMSVSLHKTITTAIDCSLETIGSHYITDNPSYSAE
jgi:nitrate reductase cytochrome c-type subunit